jgi:hypothetical protein
MADDNFDYNSYWEEKEKTMEESKARKELKEMSRGQPRKGIKGKYIKPNNHVSKQRIKLSYISALKDKD